MRNGKIRPWAAIKRLPCWILMGVLLMMSVSCKKEPEVPAPSGDGKSRALVIDIAEEASSAPHTFETIQAMMDGYAQQGLTQVWFRPIPDTYAATDSCQGSVVCDPFVQSDHMHRTVHAVFDPNLAFIQAAKRAGMTVHVLYSPYEGGGSVSIPSGASAQFSFGSVQGIGGTSVFCSAEVGAAKNQLVSSLQYENPSVVEKGKAVTLEVVFAAEAFENRTSQSEVSTLTPDASVEILPQLWYSSRNTDYEQAQDVSFTVTQERRALTDAVGNPLGELDCRVVRIDVSAYSGSTYFAVAFENGDRLYTIPFSMINLYGPDGTALTSTKAVYTRNPHSDSLLQVGTVPNDYIWGAERLPILTDSPEALTSFRAWGFEYQYGGIGSDWGDGWHNGYVYGVATGAQNQLCGNLCEGFDSVREYWLGQVDRFYAKGADTVIISLENSGGMVYDYRNFGYNYLYVKEFSERYGIEILDESFDYLQLMRLRGEYFTEFLKGVDEVAGQNGKRWGVQLLAAFENPSLDDDLNGLCHYRMPKIVFDWQPVVELCDTVLIADRQYNGYQQTVASAIRQYASGHGKQVVVMAYAACGADAAYLEAALQDPLNHCVVTDSPDVCFAPISNPQ